MDNAAVSRHADSIGLSVWSRDPARLVSMLEGDGPPHLIADRMLRQLPIPELVRGLTHAEALAPHVLSRRPEIVTERDYWLLENAVRPKAFEAMEAPDRLSAALAAMMQSGRGSLAGIAGERFGLEKLWPALAIEMSRADAAGLHALAPWLAVAVRNLGVAARVLAHGDLRTRAAIVALARATGPDSVPNDFGEDPWVVAARNAEGTLGEQDAVFLAAYLLSRALGWRSRNSAGLAVLALDPLYRAAEANRVAADTQCLIDPRLPWSMFWFDWDRCQRLRAGVAYLFVERELDPAAFGTVTADDALFGALAEQAAKSGRGRRYLRRVHYALKDADSYRYARRIRFIEKLTN